MQCPACKETIESDSQFCDQCGIELFVCSVCGRPGKGKRCIFDGQPMVKPGSGGASPDSKTETIPEPEPGAPRTQTAAPPVSGSAAQGTLRLVCAAQGIDLKPSDGDVFGRKTGPHAGIFGRFPQVSGTHLRLQKAGGLWQAVDLGSTNGSFVNGSRLAPQSPQTLSSGSRLKIADIEFVVTIGAEDGGATTRI